MTQAAPARCRAAGCEESALSFADSCWTHADQTAYVKTLASRIVEHAGLRPNLKRVVAEGLDFSHLDLRGANFNQTRLSDCQFIGTDLTDTEWIGAELYGCDFVGADAQGAAFTRATFERCSLSHTDARGANFAEAAFDNVDFLGALFHNTILWHADFEDAKHLTMKSFLAPDAPRVGGFARLCEKDPLIAFESYRTLKHYLYGQGLVEDAGWAGYRELTMERRHFLKKRDLRFIPSFFMDLLSGYTEKPNRVIAASMAIIGFFGVAYFLLDVPRPSPHVLYDRATLVDSLYFSVITFTTTGYGDFTPRPGALFRALACMEAFSGPFMAGLYIFTLTRRYAAS